MSSNVPPDRCARNGATDRPPFDPELFDRITKAICDDHHGILEGGKWRFRCWNPSHVNGDQHPSRQWDPEQGMHFCHVCGEGGGAIDLADRLGINRDTQQFRDKRRAKQSAAKAAAAGTSGGAAIGSSGWLDSSGNGAGAPPGLTVAEFIAAKRLTWELAQNVGMSDAIYAGRPVVRIPYRNEAGVEAAVRYRLALEGKDRFKWRKGDRPILYGLERLHEIRALGAVIVVEGESDAQTLWLHGFPALGIPGAAMWKPDWDGLLDGIGTIFMMIEADTAATRSYAGSNSDGGGIGCKSSTCPASRM
jgi:hypothetical protein